MIAEFKAKKRYSIINSEWVYGNLIYDIDAKRKEDVIKRAWIRTPLGTVSDTFEVNRDTVCQKTGIKDSHGEDIYEGDILKVISSDVIMTVFSVPGGFAIEGCPSEFGFGYQDGDNVFESIADLQTRTWIEECCHIIGNIYDNKNLIK